MVATHLISEIRQFARSEKRQKRPFGTGRAIANRVWSHVESTRLGSLDRRLRTPASTELAQRLRSPSDAHLPTLALRDPEAGASRSTEGQYRPCRRANYADGERVRTQRALEKKAI